MNHTEDYFIGPRGKQIYHQAWLPEGDPKAIFLVVHGLAEHSGRYMNVVDYFVPRGVAVFGLDLIGHGKSEGTRVFVERFEEFTDTIKTLFDRIKSDYPGTPLFILGHSMGALVTPYYLLDHQDGLAGAIISGTMVKIPEHVTAATVAVGKLLSVLLPKAGVVGVTADHISSDPAVVEAYVTDPLVYTGKSTARLSAEMLRAMQRVTTEAEKITLPVIIVHGSEDKLVDPDSAQLFHDLIGSEDKTLKFYEGYYHEVFNEPGREAVFADIDAWLEKQLG